MKFLIDAHLPPRLKKVLCEAGHDAIHSQDLPKKNASPDDLLNRISVDENRVIITKDSDFYYTHLLSRKPWKLVLVRTGNMRIGATLALFESKLPEIVKSLENCSLVEITENQVVEIL
jgi:predicted nuclease of predicted toxin-antitoxin system